MSADYLAREEPEKNIGPRVAMRKEKMESGALEWVEKMTTKYYCTCKLPVPSNPIRVMTLVK